METLAAVAFALIATLSLLWLCTRVSLLTLLFIVIVLWQVWAMSQ
jgi:hypothetical protein